MRLKEIKKDDTIPEEFQDRLAEIYYRLFIIKAFGGELEQEGL